MSQKTYDVVVFGVHGCALNTEIEAPDHEARKIITVSRATRVIAGTAGMEADPDFVNTLAGDRSKAKFEAIARHTGVAVTEKQLARMSELHRIAKDSICNEQAIDPMPGVEALLAAYRAQGIICVAVTSDPADRAEIALGTAGLRSLFDGGVFGMTAKNTKDAIFKDIIAASGITPDRILVVDDGPSEIKLAKKFGMAAIGFVDPAFTGEHRRSRISQFKQADADSVIVDGFTSLRPF